MDFPSYRMPTPPVMTPCTMHSLGAVLAGLSSAVMIGSGFSTAWTANNKAYYYPFALTEFATARQLLFWVGATSSGDIDVGIYTGAGNLIVSAGSTAMSATVNTVQELNITDTLLAPGDYFLGVVCSTTVGTCFVALSDSDETVLSSLPVYQEALGGSTLPATATPVLSTDATPPIYIVGIQFASAF